MSPQIHFLLRAVLTLILCVLVLDSYGFLSPSRTHPDGITVIEEPLQTATTNSPWQHKGYTISPLADYSIRGRVITFGRFYFSTGADISPLDITLGWGPLSDQRILQKVAFSHAPRIVFITFDDSLPMPYPELNRHFSNNHIIPADEKIRKELFKVRKGDIVKLKGHLVTVNSPTFSWGTSLSREDSGNGACELFWVNSVIIEE